MKEKNDVLRYDRTMRSWMLVRTYLKGLDITGLDGTAQQPIVIGGPAAGSPAVIAGRCCCNTVELTNSSHVGVANAAPTWCRS
jgi:hypothetical protein